MSSGKRFTDNRVGQNLDKGQGSSQGTDVNGKHGGNHLAVNDKTRSRSTGGGAHNKLSIPPPVSLPSTKKENHGTDPQAQSFQPMSGAVGRQRAEESNKAERWSQHVTPRGMEANRGSEETASPKLPINDQTEFPPLHTATQSKLNPKAKPVRPIRNPELHESTEWTEDDRTHQDSYYDPSFHRSANEKDEPFAQMSEMHVPYGAVQQMYPAYGPMETHGPSGDRFPHPYYMRPAFFHPHGYDPRFGNEYYMQGHPEAYFPAFVHPMYAPMHPNYNPEGEQDLKSVPSDTLKPQGSKDGRPLIAQTKESEVESTSKEAKASTLELNNKGSGRPEIADNSHVSGKPNKGDLLHDEGTRREPLYRDGSAQIFRQRSRTLDWAEEADEALQEIENAPNPSESVRETESQPEPEYQSEASGWESREPLFSKPIVQRSISQSPMRRGHHPRDLSADERRSTAASDIGTFSPWSEKRRPGPQDGWQRNRQRPFESQPERFQRTEPFRQEPRHRQDWHDRQEYMPRGRGSRGWNRSGRGGRSPRRGRSFDGGERGRSRAPMMRGRLLFAGRGFRGTRPEGQLETVDSETAHSQETTSSIRFGQFDLPMEGDFDPFANRNAHFQQSNEDVASDDLSNPVFDSSGHGHDSNSRLRLGPAQMDLVSARPYVGNVLSDENNEYQREGSKEPSFVRRYDSERGTPRGRYPQNSRGRYQSRGRWQPGREPRPYEQRDSFRGRMESDFRGRGRHRGSSTPRGRRFDASPNRTYFNRPADGERRWRDGDRDGPRRGQNRRRDSNLSQGSSVQSWNQPRSPKTDNPRMQWVEKKQSREATPSEAKSE